MPRFDFTARDRDGKLKDYGYLDMENQADGPATMTFYGDIVATEGWREDRTPQQIADFLASLTQGQQINLYFNSPGGDAYAGVAMHNILSRWQGRKVAYVDAIAASAATMPLMACDEIHLAAGAEVMIHDPWAWAAGNAAELRETAARLDKVGDHYADIYTTHAAEGVTRDQLREAMRAETWLDGSNIGQYFDVIVDETEAAAPAASASYARYKATPPALLEKADATRRAQEAAESATAKRAENNTADAAKAAQAQQSRAQALLADLYLYGT